MSSMGDRLKNAREQAGYTNAASAAAALNVSVSTYRAHENGQNEFGADEASRYGRKFKVSPSWLLMGDSNDLRHLSPKRSGDVANFNIHAGMGNGGLLSVMVDENGEASDFADSDGSWSFPDRIRNGFSQIKRTYSMPVTGDSMEPTLPNGAYVFVDTSHTIPSPEDIYALDYGDGLMVKRLKLIPKTDRIKVISDNPRYGDDELQRDGVQIYGRVIAYFQWR